MAYLSTQDINALVQAISAGGLEHDYIDAMVANLPPAWVAANLPAGNKFPLPRLRHTLGVLNQAAPIGGMVPITVVLESLATDPSPPISDLAMQLLGRIVLATPAGPPTLEAALADFELTGAWLFAGRRDLRKRLARMAQVNGAPVIIVNGDADVGKSHTCKLLVNAVQKSQAFRFAHASITEEKAASYTPDWLVQDLVDSLVPGAGDPPAEISPRPRWYGKLASWTLDKLATAGTDRPLWLAIDGLRHPALSPEIVKVVVNLVERVALATGPLIPKLVLIDCEPATVLSTGCVAEQEQFAHVTVAEAEECLQALKPADFAATWPGVRAAIEAAGATSAAVHTELKRVLP